MDRFLEKTSLFPSLSLLTPPKSGGGGGGGGRGGTPAAFPWRARPPTPRKLMDHRRFRTGHRGFFGKNPNPPPPPRPFSPTLSEIRHQRGPPTPATPPHPNTGAGSGLCSTNCPKLLQLLNCLGPGATPYPLYRGASVSQLFGILPSRLRCSSNHAMRKASFEPTSGFRPFNYALAGSAA